MQEIDLGRVEITVKLNYRLINFRVFYTLQLAFQQLSFLTTLIPEVRVHLRNAS